MESSYLFTEQYRRPECGFARHATLPQVGRHKRADAPSLIMCPSGSEAYP